uniref:Plakophilin 1b n=1 Tax=Neolamprologus brichardi TaxID=32507 RepID=A0A3Q4MGM8_NEOBR
GPSSYIDPSVFNCATGCLRNLSSGRGGQRQAMRSCPGLIDSLMSYMKSCVAEQNPDDSSLENCACILHNLSYKLEQESPVSFINYNPNRDAQPEKSPTIGCFSPKSIFNLNLPSLPPSGVKWLSHPKAIDTYLSLLESSENKATLEACCGALQNLTASKGNVSTKKLIIRIMVLLCNWISSASLLLYSIWQDKNLQSKWANGTAEVTFL